MRTFLLYLLFISSTYAQDKPNIVWFTFEDTSPAFLGCYGNKNAKTPIMDFFAREGVRMNRAFSTGSVCSPSRTALITGLKTYVTGTGNHRSKYPLPDFIKGFPKFLRDAGYYTSNNAKTDYNVENENDFILEAWNESSSTAGWWKREKDQPFFAVFNSNSSHQSRTMTWPFEEYKKEIWDPLPEDLKTKDDAFPMPPFYLDSPEMRKEMARVYNSLTKSNLEFQELFERLKREGLLENTIIFCFADHGEGMPRMKTNGIALGHQVPFTIWFPEKWKHLSPWGTGNKECNELIDFTDLAPTVLSLAGTSIPEYMQGRILLGKNRKKEPTKLHLSTDRSDESYDLTRTIIQGNYAYSRIYLPFIPELRYLKYMDIGEITKIIRQDSKSGNLNKTQSFLTRKRPVEFLFDLENDPWEINNLADQQEYLPLLEKFRKDLKDEILIAKDIHFLPELEFAEVSEKGNLFTYRNSNYPIENIYAMAELCGFLEKKVLNQQISGLTYKNKFVRYWALMGLKVYSAKELEAEKTLIKKCLKDEYVLNRILAASILYEHEEEFEAKNILEKEVLSEKDQVANFALQQILYMKNGMHFKQIIEELASRERAKQKSIQLFHTTRSISLFNYIFFDEPLTESFH